MKTAGSVRSRSWTPIFLAAVLSVFLLQVFPVLYADAAATASNDTEYQIFNGKARVLQPKYWVIQERSRDGVYDVIVDSVTLHDQADSGSRATKYVLVFHSTRSGIFSLPEEVTKKVSDKQLVNFYMYQNLKNVVEAKLLKAETVSMNGSDGYMLTWKYLSPRGVVFEVKDLFLFKGDDVYQYHGEYALNHGTLPKEKVDAIIGSATLLK